MKLVNRQSTFLRASVALLFLMLNAAGAAAIDVPEGAFASGAVDEGEPRAETRLLVDHESVAPGQQIRVGVMFDLDEHWHVYGEDPGDAGLPTSLVYESKPSSDFDEIAWPTTEHFLDPAGQIETKGYANRVVLTSTLKVPDDASGALDVSAEVDYLACRVKCLPGSGELTRTIPIGESKPAGEAVQMAFDEYGASREPLSTEPIRVVPAKGESAEDLSATTRAEQPTAEPAPTAPVNQLPLWQVLLFAFLGGVLLNLMPCVFPVLALKVFGFVSGGGHDRKTALQHSGMYSAGILASMLVLAGAVLVVQWTGAQVGWGFQFQEPGYLIALTLIVTLFSLNLFGAFDVPLLPIPSRAASGEATPGRSFVDGGLAVVLATPCSAPFLGTAVGFALASSATTIVTTFVAIGLGLAAPFVLASAVPQVARILPKPGAWMETFERLLGFILLGTSVWIVWVFGRVAGADAVARLLAATLVASFGLWVWGRLQYRDGKRRAIGALVAVASIAGGLLAFQPWQVDAPAAAPTTATTAGSSDWQPWDKERIAREQAAGRVVFVDFTADWCITCKVNERTVLAGETVQAAFARQDVVPMMADWTRRDDLIRQELARFGRGGVPMYLVYPAGGGEPEVLPELLTPELVTSAIERGLRPSEGK